MSNQKLKTVDIKGKPYVEVSTRLEYFRDNFENYSLISEMVQLDEISCVIKASVIDDKGIVRATGFAREVNGSTFINKTSYVENCETSAWGRALGNFGIGIEGGIASANEVVNAVNNQDKTIKKQDKPTMNPQKVREEINKQIIEMKEAKTDEQCQLALDRCVAFRKTPDYIEFSKSNTTKELRANYGNAFNDCKQHLCDLRGDNV